MAVTPRKGGRPWRVARAHFLATTDQTHCWICRRYVDRDLPGTHPRGPSADHLVALQDGGPELPKDGAVLMLAHLSCNSSRGRRGRTTRPRARHATTSRDW